MNEKVTVGKEFELLKKRFSDARECGYYSIRERKLLRNSIMAVDYVKSFFEGTSHLPPLEESASTSWGKTFNNLWRAFSYIEEAERLLDGAHLYYDIKKRGFFVEDKIISFLAFDGKVNIKCINSTKLVEEARKIHDLSPVTTAALGRLLTMGSLMGSNLKEKNDKITLQIKADGPIDTMIAVASNDGNVKGYIKNPNIDIPLKSNGKLDVGGAVGKNGMLYIIKDIGLKEPYVGLTPLVSGEIAEDFTEYFAKSEQVPTAIALGVLVDKDGVRSAGGYIVQLMPDATNEDITILEQNLRAMPPISKLLEENKSLEDIAGMITGDGMLFMVGEDLLPEYKCDCQKSRIKNGLISLGAKEIQNIIDTDGKAEVVCKFCKKKYEFSKEDLEKIKEECK